MTNDSEIIHVYSLSIHLCANRYVHGNSLPLTSFFLNPPSFRDRSSGYIEDTMTCDLSLSLAILLQRARCVSTESSAIAAINASSFLNLTNGNSLTEFDFEARLDSASELPMRLQRLVKLIQTKGNDALF